MPVLAIPPFRRSAGAVFRSLGRLAALALLLPLLTGCATFYQRNEDFQQDFRAGDYEAALQAQQRSEKKAGERNRLLWLLQEGTALRALGRYEESNAAFEEAYKFAEDLQRNGVVAAASLVVNPAMRTYRGEDFERLQIHYFKALNHLDMGRLDDALVEARRLNIYLNAMVDKRGDKSGVYRRDAFAWNLTGLLFEAEGDANNAFIAYRNAYDAYREDYKPLFGLDAPAQLKRDLVRSARRSGLSDEATRYAVEFGLDPAPPALGDGEGELVVLWNDGLGPVKDEWSLNFVLVKRQGGLFFVNDELGLTLPFNGNGQGSSSLSDLSVVRMALARYLVRPATYPRATVSVAGGAPVRLEKAQDIERIALAELQRRRAAELVEAVARVALKQAAEYRLRQENPWLGLLASLVNASTEKADTRNWQTLPASVHYARLTLPAGAQTVELRPQRSDGGFGPVQRAEIEIHAGRTTFLSLATVDCGLPVKP